MQNHSCRDALPQKNTSAKTNETSCKKHRSAFTLATIPTSFQSQINIPIPYSHAQELPAHPLLPAPPSPPSTSTPLHNPTTTLTSIIQCLKTQHFTLQPSQTLTQQYSKPQIQSTPLLPNTPTNTFHTQTLLNTQIFGTLNHTPCHQALLQPYKHRHSTSTHPTTHIL